MVNKLPKNTVTTKTKKPNTRISSKEENLSSKAPIMELLLKNKKLKMVKKKVKKNIKC